MFRSVDKYCKGIYLFYFCLLRIDYVFTFAIRKVCVSESRAFDSHLCVLLRKYALPNET